MKWEYCKHFIIFEKFSVVCGGSFWFKCQLSYFAEFGYWHWSKNGQARQISLVSPQISPGPGTISHIYWNKNEIFYLDVEILPTTLGFVDIFKVGESISKLFCVETTAQKDFAKQSIFRKVNLKPVPITQK